MIENLSRAKRNLALALVALLILWFAWSIRTVLNPVILGYLCAFILTPAVVWFERRGFSRLTAVNLTFVVGFLGAGLVALLMGVQVLGLVNEIRSSGASSATLAPVPLRAEELGTVEAEDAGRAQVEPISISFKDRFVRRTDKFKALLSDWEVGFLLPVSSEEVYAGLSEKLNENQEELFGAAGSGVRFFLAFIGSLMGLTGMFLLLPLYAYYFLFVQKDLRDFTESCIPKAHRERIMRVGGQIGEVVASFFRGRLSVSLIKGLLISVGLSVCGVEYAFLLGMTSGLLSVVPFVGPFLGFLMSFALDWTLRPEDVQGVFAFGMLPSLVRCAIVFGIAELIEGYVLVPRILGDSLGLHPLVVFVALLAGGAALGTLGILVSLPLTAVLVILFKEFVRPAIRDFVEE